MRRKKATVSEPSSSAESSTASAVVPANTRPVTLPRTRNLNHYCISSAGPIRRCSSLIRVSKVGKLTSRPNQEAAFAPKSKPKSNAPAVDYPNLPCYIAQDSHISTRAVASSAITQVYLYMYARVDIYKTSHITRLQKKCPPRHFHLSMQEGFDPRRSA
jgi:hypothetical protein